MSVSSKDMWKQNESKNGDAIIALAEDGSASLVVLLTAEPWKIRLVNDFNGIGEMEYLNTFPGLYYANMKEKYGCGGSNGVGHIGMCAGDCHYVDWTLVKSIHAFCMEEITAIIINQYDSNHNVFLATTNDYRVISFDPFVFCAIELSDEEYYDQTIAQSIVGHKFAIRGGCGEHLAPNKEDIIYTSWKDNRNGE